MQYPLNPIKTVAISGYTAQIEYALKIKSLIAKLREAGCNLLFKDSFAQFLIDNNISEIGHQQICTTFPENAQAVLSIGGDGTFLRTQRWVAHRQIPIMGINTGHLGYLASYKIENPDTITKSLTHGEAIVEHRSMLHLKSEDLPDNTWPYALNEITLHKEDTSSMISVHASIDDIPLATYQADGLIISTSSGSTAYNLSAGGPIVQPTFHCMLLTPIAPHSLTLRPMVISPESIVSLTTESRSGVYRVSLDNRSFMLKNETKLTIEKAPFSCHIIRRPNDNFVSILRNKLLWGLR